MDQQFSLSWNNFHGNLTKGFAGLLGKAEFVDVTIAVDGHLLQAHKVILSICSPYFKKMFQMNPCQHPIIVLRDVTHKAMRDLLQFMYHGEVSVKREDLTSFIGTAEVLQIKGLTNKETEDENSETIENATHKDVTENVQTSPEPKSSANNSYSSRNEDSTHNTELEFKQREFMEKLQRLSTLKRKSEEFLQKSYYADLINSEKKPKVKDKSPYNKTDNHIVGSNYDNFRSLYEEQSTEVMSKFAPQNKNNELKDRYEKEQTTPENLEVKTECDDSDIIVTDPAICKTPNNYENSHENHKDYPIPQEYQSPQDNALSLVMDNTSENQQLPCRYKYIYSRKGHKQLVHMNFVYTKHSTSHGKTSWRCVQYFSLNRCPATVETIESMIYAINHEHNHEDCYDKLVRNTIYEMESSK